MRGALVVVLALSACADESRPPVETAVPFTAAELAVIRTMSPLPALPKSPTNRVADDARAARLGQRLFFDKRLSRNGEVSCATCHDPARGFSDARTTAKGLSVGRRNTPTLWNAGHATWLFWDGRADSLWAQALGPIENDLEMGFSRVGAWHLVGSDAALRAEYEAVFGARPTLDAELPAHARPGEPAWEALPAAARLAIDRHFANLGKAIAAYERRLLSRGSVFDDFVRGLQTNDQALVDRMSPSAQRGLQVFVGKGQCTLCHTGPNMTDGEFHNIGLHTPDGAEVDVGRYDGVVNVKKDRFNGFGEFSDDRSEPANMHLTFVTKKLNNLGEFKTPTLRNVATTGPFMHDGRFATLADVVDYYTRLEKPKIGHREESLVPLQLDAAERRGLVDFLTSLTGKALPDELVRPIR